jgi:hypothetical protein
MPLKKGFSNQVHFKLADASMTEEEKKIVLEQARELREESIPFSFHRNTPPIASIFPVTHIVYSWLWNDLEKLKLVSGNFSPHIW